MNHSEFTSWSPTYGCEVARISVVNANNEEYFAIIPTDPPKGRFRDLRNKAVDKLNEAIGLGIEPGEIRWRT